MVNHPNRNKTLAAFVAASNIPASLIRAVVKQSGGWAEFKLHAEDVTNHGAAGGFSGFTYYNETAAFTEANKTAILDMAKQQAEEIGVSGALSLIASFQCLDGFFTPDSVAEALYDKDADRTEVFNALAWYALEEVCRAYVDFKEGE